MSKITEVFGTMVYNEAAMKATLPKDIYASLKRTGRVGQALDPTVAGVIANAMKDWAIERGATHFSHWFQPMTGITAEKHSSFVCPTKDGGVIMEFSAKELLLDEPDASSFPSGGLRATFEARGYSAWDPTSYAFIKERTLYIPSIFFSSNGHVLDRKTPLLRSMERVNEQALRILRLFGDTTSQRVVTSAGAEQEYFLVDKDLYKKRQDLFFCGRTLFGAKPPKGQEMEDHYFGSLRPRVLAYMEDLDTELWKVGVYAKTEHNEAAPAQHELACVYTTSNRATDHNQLTMEFMKKVAERHNLTCLLHEKPFAGINGSGKHNNWSLMTDRGENLFEPGTSPIDNAKFLLFLCAVIKAVDDHQDLLRLSCASAGNDHRLGAAEAPPAIISLYLGDEIEAVLDALESGNDYQDPTKKTIKVGVDALPPFPCTSTDRNRTSPFAFTGNKFEFRMPGSSFSIAGINTILNVILAEALDNFANHLEQGNNFKEDLHQLIHDTIAEHRRIIFSGDSYTDNWQVEAEKRGLLNLRSTPEALSYLIAPKNIALYEKYGIFTEEELHSRYEILMENYYKVINIEGQTMVDMIRRQILPAVSKYNHSLCQSALLQRQVMPDLQCDMEEKIIAKLTALSNTLYQCCIDLEELLIKARDIENTTELAQFSRDKIFSLMQETRIIADEMEILVAKDYWPFPSYGQLLYSV